MRAVLASVLLMLSPAVAAAAPLDPDRSFGRSGVLRLSQPQMSTAVIATKDGGTLHTTSAGLLRVTAAGRVAGIDKLDPPGHPVDLVATSGGTAVIGTPPYDGRAPAPLAVWILDRTGRTTSHGTVSIPGAGSIFPQRIVRRGPGFAALVQYQRPGEYDVDHAVIALTAEGALEESWADRGIRRLSRGATMIGADRAGRLVAVTQGPGCSGRARRRPVIRIQRFDLDGAREADRRMRVGEPVRCGTLGPGEIKVDSRGRAVVAANFAHTPALLRLRRDLRPDATFGRRGERPLSGFDALYLAVRVELRPGGGYVVGFTDEDDEGLPKGSVALVDRRGRRFRARRLRHFKSYPTSDLHDIALDRRGRIVAAGALHDTDLFIREDYGQPHFAAWRLRTR